jgi:hypothetical protein
VNTATTFTPDMLFAEIGTCEFDRYATFEATVLEHFNAHVLDFPPGYGWSDAVEWALHRNVVRRAGGVIYVAPLASPVEVVV